jgi:hypothetical protein
MNAALGAWLLAPWVFGVGQGAAVWANAWVCGAALCTVVVLALIPSELPGMEWTNVAVGSWLLVSPFVFGLTGAAAWNASVVGALAATLAVLALPLTVGTTSRMLLATVLAAELLVTVGVLVVASRPAASVAFAALPATALSWILAHHLLWAPPWHARRLHPGMVARYGGSEKLLGSGRLCEQIGERCDRIRRTLSEAPSETEIEMCAIGYRICLDDMVTATETIERESSKAGSLRRLSLGLYRGRRPRRSQARATLWARAYDASNDRSSPVSRDAAADRLRPLLSEAATPVR